MAIDFNSEWFKSLSLKEQKELSITEFKNCKNSFKYFVDNYAKIRHPNAGIIKVKLFDFQYDVAIPISEAIKTGRSKETIEQLEKYKFKYDYKKHMELLYEQYLDTYKKVPLEFHNFFKIVINHPEYIKNVDTIILKSRQTGLSTVFQLLQTWHINFYTSVYNLTLSQGDKEAIKYIADCQRIYELLPRQIKAKRMKNNDHELWLTLGNKDVVSILQAFTSTPKAGRSYSPNLVILDEFAFWRRPEETYTAISMALSGGGIMVVISTPNGVGNLYHKLWELSKQHYSVYIKNKDKSKKNKKENKEKKTDDINLSIMKPIVVHWSQLPIDEFKRRGFNDPIDWYKFMKSKLMIEGGERRVAQELDLDFIMSGDTLLPFSVIKKLKEQAIEQQYNKNIINSNTIEGLTIYEKPLKNHFYIFGVDVSEGVYQDYHSIYIIKCYNDKNEKVLPTIVAKYKNNSLSPKKFAKILVSIAKLYNNALLNIEKNNPGLVVLSELIENKLYDDNLILNKYNPTTNKFLKNEKGFRTSRTTKPYLISIINSYVMTYLEYLSLPQSLIDEFITFYEDSYHDDEAISYGLALIGYQLVEKYKDFLYENINKSKNKRQLLSEMTNNEIDDYCYSSQNIEYYSDSEDINKIKEDIYDFSNIKEDIKDIENDNNNENKIKENYNNLTAQYQDKQNINSLFQILNKEINKENIPKDDIINNSKEKISEPFKKFISKVDLTSLLNDTDIPVF